MTQDLFNTLFFRILLFISIFMGLMAERLSGIIARAIYVVILLLLLINAKMVRIFPFTLSLVHAVVLLIVTILLIGLDILRPLPDADLSGNSAPCKFRLFKNLFICLDIYMLLIEIVLLL